MPAAEDAPPPIPSIGASDHSRARSAHIWRDNDSWRVGPDFSTGLDVPSFEAALDLADLWLRVAGLNAIVIRREDGSVDQVGGGAD
jgi:hypothetical protein